MGSYKNKMKFLASIVAALAVANPVPADDPAPAPASDGNTMDTDIIMINMNSANIQMNMGDFRGSDVPGDFASQNSTFQWISGMSAEDQDQLKELMKMDEMQAGLETLAENFPAFAGMINALGDLAEEDTTAETTTVQPAGEWDDKQKSFWQRTKEDCPVMKHI